MKVLVTGGTGTVGSHVVNELLKRDVHVTILTRQNKHEADLPKNVTHLQGDLLNPQTIRTMCQNMDAMFLLNAVSTTEAHEGLMAVNGALMGDVKKIVYLSVYKIDRAPHLPHFGAKLAIEATLKSSEIPYTILRANSFMQNDHRIRDSLMKFGVYPLPLGNTGVSRVDVRDIAEAAAITLTGDKYKNNTLNVVGPEIHTGKSTAEIWSKVLNKEIYYGGDNLNAWEQQALNFLPDWMAFDLKLMYDFFQRKGFKARMKDVRHLTALLEHPPRRFEDFARETAEMWKEKPVIKK